VFRQFSESSQIGANDDVELLEGRGLADAGDPKNKDTELRVFQAELAFRVVHYQLPDVHQTELVLGLLLWRHWVAQLPKPLKCIITKFNVRPPPSPPTLSVMISAVTGNPCAGFSRSPRSAGFHSP
jgi:hypothetical protein